MNVNQAGVAINLTASGALTATRGTLIGYHVNSTTAGTIVIRDGGSTGTALSGTITPSPGFNAFPCTFQSASGGYATIGGTLDVTFFVAGQ